MNTTEPRGFDAELADKFEVEILLHGVRLHVTNGTDLVCEIMVMPPDSNDQFPHWAINCQQRGAVGFSNDWMPAEVP